MSAASDSPNPPGVEPVSDAQELPPEPEPEPERRDCHALPLAPPAKGEYCRSEDYTYTVIIETEQAELVFEEVKRPTVDSSGRYIWLFWSRAASSPDEPGVVERVIVDGVLGTTHELESDPRCDVVDGRWSRSHLIAWQWPDDPEDYNPSRVNICIADPSGKILHVLDKQRLCWGTASAHYVSSLMELSPDGEALIVFHGGCSLDGTLGWMLRLSDGSYRRISSTEPRVPGHRWVSREHDLIFGQDEVFELEVSADTTFEAPRVRAVGLGSEYELVFGALRSGPKPERPRDGLPVIR